MAQVISRDVADTKHDQKLYENNCKSCHATVNSIKLIGNAAQKRHFTDLSDQLLDLRIRHGRHVKRAGDSVMPLSADDMRDLLAYIRKQEDK